MNYDFDAKHIARIATAMLLLATPLSPALSEASSPTTELIRKAKEDAKDTVYIIALETDYSGGMRSLSKGACTLTSYINGQDKYGVFIQAAYKSASASEPINKRGQKFTITYGSFDEVLKNYDKSHRILSLNNSGACAYYVDFARNTYLLISFFEKNFPQQGFEWGFLDSKKVWAEARGFKSFEEYTVASQMGADPTQYRSLESRGISSLDSYRAIVSEMKSSGYSDEGSPALAMVYYDDKLESQKTGKSPIQIRNERNKRVAVYEARKKAADAAAEASSPRSYYLICNAPASYAKTIVKVVDCKNYSSILKSLQWAFLTLRREQPQFAPTCSEAIVQLNKLSSTNPQIIPEAAKGLLARCNTGLAWVEGPSKNDEARLKR